MNILLKISTKHLADYVQEAFGPTLKSHGFSCCNNRLHWYRIHGETIQCILFCAYVQGSLVRVPFRATHIIPFYVPPVYPKGVNQNLLHGTFDGRLYAPRVVDDSRLYPNNNWQFKPYSNEAPVPVVVSPYNGLADLCDDIRIMSGIKNSEQFLDAYIAYKTEVTSKYHKIMPKSEANYTLISDLQNRPSPELTSQLIVLGREDLYEYFHQPLLYRLSWMEKEPLAKHKEKREMVEDIRMQLRVIENGERNSYLEFLNNRAKVNLLELHNKTGIPIPAEYL